VYVPSDDPTLGLAQIGIRLRVQSYGHVVTVSIYSDHIQLYDRHHPPHSGLITRTFRKELDMARTDIIERCVRVANASCDRGEVARRA
jgi:hypothetical protein